VTNNGVLIYVQKGYKANKKNPPLFPVALPTLILGAKPITFLKGFLDKHC